MIEVTPALLGCRSATDVTEINLAWTPEGDVVTKVSLVRTLVASVVTSGKVQGLGEHDVGVIYDQVRNGT